MSAALYFNLGNALFKSGQIGRAIVNYRLAGQLAPRDPDIRANLRFARNHVDGADARPGAWWRRWTGHLTLNEWSALVAVAGWLWFILLALPQWRPALKRPLRGYTAAAGLVAAFLSACLALNYYDRFEIQSAIVVAREAAFQPADEAPGRSGLRTLLRDRGVLVFAGCCALFALSNAAMLPQGSECFLGIDPAGRFVDRLER